MAAAALIQHLAWELTFATQAALKRKNKNKKPNQTKQKALELCSTGLQNGGG